ncbi:unnamed protein product, partial [Didymodactylos carnosus]
ESLRFDTEETPNIQTFYIRAVLRIPTYFIWTVVEKPASTYFPDIYSINSTATIYWFNALLTKKFESFGFHISAIFLKIIPVCVLITFSLLLIHSIRSARRIRQHLQQGKKTRRYSSSLGNSTRELRTTTMLVLITIFTAFVELPQ